MPIPEPDAASPVRDTMFPVGGDAASSKFGICDTAEARITFSNSTP
jgi:hypothetical protein